MNKMHIYVTSANNGATEVELDSFGGREIHQTINVDGLVEMCLIFAMQNNLPRWERTIGKDVVPVNVYRVQYDA